MTTLIIPDIHENIRGVERIQAQAGPVDHTVFTGDWLDRKGGWATNLAKTLRYLEEHGDDPDKTFLLGNHDMGYLDRGWPQLGYNENIDPWLFRNFRLHTEVEGWTLSHAGFVSKEDVAQSEEALSCAWKGQRHPLLGIGLGRYGDQWLGGCVWLDWNLEFEPVLGLKQIVGHTIDKKPRWNGENLCLDTQLRNFAIIQDGKVTVHDVRVTDEDRRWLQQRRKLEEAWTR